MVVVLVELPLLSFLAGWNADAGEAVAEKLGDLRGAKEFEEEEDEMENEMELEAANEFEAKEFGDVKDDLDVNEVTEDGNLNDDASVRFVCT